jgi:hypothetical protein
LNQSDDLENQSRGCASDSDVKACIKEIVLVFQKAEFEIGISRAFLDLADAAKADSVDGNLQSKKNGQGDEVGGVHSVSFRLCDFSLGGGLGEIQTIAGKRVGVKPRGF